MQNNSIAIINKIKIISVKALLTLALSSKFVFVK